VCITLAGQEERGETGGHLDRLGIKKKGIGFDR